jgi:hypothetical protein
MLSLTSQQKKLLYWLMLHLNHRNNEVGQSQEQGPDTSSTVYCCNYIDRNTRHLLEDVNLPVNWILINKSARTVRDKSFIKAND